MLAFWAVVVWIIVTLAQWGRYGIHAPYDMSNDRSSDDILARGCLPGEIGEGEYKRRVAVLRGGVQGSAGPPPAGSPPPSSASPPAEVS